MNTDRGAALVTGANRGLGRTLAIRLARLGYNVAVNYRTKQAEAEDTVATILAAGGRAFTVQADVTQPEEAARAVEQAHEQGGLAALVNNVGDYHEGPLADLDYGTFMRMIESNLGSVFLTCQAAVSLMEEGGRVVNIGYAGAEHMIARPSIAPYSLAKTGVILYSKALARTVAGRGITVNVVSPGVLENSVTLPRVPVPAGRLGSLEELAGAVEYLLSPEAAYTTGITLEVGGGFNV